MSACLCLSPGHALAFFVLPRGLFPWGAGHGAPYGVLQSRQKKSRPGPDTIAAVPLLCLPRRRDRTYAVSVKPPLPVQEQSRSGPAAGGRTARHLFVNPGSRFPACPLLSGLAGKRKERRTELRRSIIGQLIIRRFSPACEAGGNISGGRKED